MLYKQPRTRTPKKQITARIPWRIAQTYIRICTEHHIYPGTGLVLLAAYVAAGLIDLGELVEHSEIVRPELFTRKPKR